MVEKTNRRSSSLLCPTTFPNSSRRLPRTRQNSSIARSRICSRCATNSTRAGSAARTSRADSIVLPVPVAEMTRPRRAPVSRRGRDGLQCLSLHSIRYYLVIGPFLTDFSNGGPAWRHTWRCPAERVLVNPPRCKRRGLIVPRVKQVHELLREITLGRGAHSDIPLMIGNQRGLSEVRAAEDGGETIIAPEDIALRVVRTVVMPANLDTRSRNANNSLNALGELKPK